MLVRRDDHLRRVNLELQITARQIVGAQRLQIGVEFGPGVLVRFGVPAEPPAGIEVEQRAQSAFAEGLVANNPDLLDGGPFAFGDSEREVDPVAFDRRYSGHHLGSVKAAVDVLTLELLLGAIQHCLVEGAAVGKPGVTQRIAQ